MPFEPKFPECVECRWFRRSRCLPCGAGEFFEEVIEDNEPEEVDLIELMNGWSEDND